MTSNPRVYIIYGIKASGKSTLIREFYSQLTNREKKVIVLDDTFLEVSPGHSQNPFSHRVQNYHGVKTFSISDKRWADPVIRMILSQNNSVVMSLRGLYPSNYFSQFIGPSGEDAGPTTIFCTTTFKDLLEKDSTSFYKDILENKIRKLNPSYISDTDDQVPGVTYKMENTDINPDFTYDRSLIGMQNIPEFVSSIIGLG